MKPKISGMEAHHTGNPWTYQFLEVKRSKVKVAGPINAVTTMHHTQVEGIKIFLNLACCMAVLRTLNINVLGYISAKNYENQHITNKVTAKIKSV